MQKLGVQDGTHSNQTMECYYYVWAEVHNATAKQDAGIYNHIGMPSISHQFPRYYHRRRGFCRLDSRHHHQHPARESYGDSIGRPVQALNYENIVAVQGGVH